MRNFSLILDISIHSLARRLTVSLSKTLPQTTHFNSQPRKEADGRENATSRQELAFQFTASQGG